MHFEQSTKFSCYPQNAKNRREMPLGRYFIKIQLIEYTFFVFITRTRKKNFLVFFKNLLSTSYATSTYCLWTCFLFRKWQFKCHSSVNKWQIFEVKCIWSYISFLLLFLYCNNMNRQSVWSHFMHVSRMRLQMEYSNDRQS